MNVFDLFAKISLDTSGYESGLNSAASKASSFGSAIKNGLAKVSQISIAAVTAITTATAATTTALIKGASEVASYGDNIDKMSQKIGISAQAYQEWDAILQHSGASVDSLQMGMKTLRNAMDSLGEATGEAVVDQEALATAQLNYNNALLDANQAQREYDNAIKEHGSSSNEAANALTKLQKANNNVEKAQIKVEKAAAGSTEKLSDAAQALLLLGVSATDSSGKLRDEEDVFAEVITALQNMDNETEKARLASVLLGRSGTELGALLNTSAEDTEKMRQAVHDLGGVMSNEAVKASAKYTDTLQDMKTAFSGLKRGLLSEFLPSITSVMEGLTDVFGGKGTDKITEGINNFIDKIGESLPKVIATGSQITFTLVEAISKNLPTLIDSLINSVFGNVDKIASLATKLINAFLVIFKTVAKSISKNSKQFVNAFKIIVKDIIGIFTDTDLIYDILDAGTDLLESFVDGIAEVLPDVINIIVKVITKIVDKLTDPRILLIIINAGIRVLSSLIKGIIQAIPELLKAVPVIISNLATTLTNNDSISKIIQSAVSIVSEIAKNIPTIISALIDKVPEIIGSITGEFGGDSDMFVGDFSDIVSKIADEWPTIIASVINKISSIVNRIGDTFKDQENVETLKNALTGLLDATMDFMLEIIAPLVDAVPDMVDVIADAITDDKTVDKLSKSLGEVMGKLVDRLPEIVGVLFKTITNIFANMFAGISNAGAETQRSVIKKFFPDFDTSKIVPDKIQYGNFLSDEYGKISSLSEEDYLKAIGAIGNDFSVTPNRRNTVESASNPVVVELSVDKTVFGKVVFDLNRAESKRRGVTVLDNVDY